MSLLKRKAEALGEQVVSAAVGEFVARTVSAAADRHDAGARVEEQLERLGTLVVMVHSAVDAAEGVHIRSWWLRRWLWRLRDAALDGDEVLRSFTQRRAAEPRQAAGATALWNAARRFLRSAKSKFMATGIGDFLKLLELEIRRSLPALPVLTQSPAGTQEHDIAGEESSTNDSFYSTMGTTIFMPVQGDEPDRGSCDFENMLDSLLAAAVPQPTRHGTTPGGEDTSVVSSDDEPPMGTTADPPSASIISSDYHLSTISHQEYISNRTRIGLLILRHKIRRAMDRLRAAVTLPAPPAASRLDTDRLRDLVSDIHRAARTCDVPDQVNAKGWLARWRRHLQAVADRGEDAIAVLVEDNGDDEVMATVRSVEAAAAFLEAFLTLAKIAVVRPNAYC
ncbi:unnamed protein product [Urochloa decumbens]|uniref:Disease resistance N-terminal domain-containing protein n=1 Tax=Urochloa decumbens TaxID=240449 RepID=A0ABC9FM19_9POAL